MAQTATIGLNWHRSRIMYCYNARPALVAAGPRLRRVPYLLCWSSLAAFFSISSQSSPSLSSSLPLPLPLSLP